MAKRTKTTKVDFDVLTEISTVAGKLAKSKLKVRRTKVFSEAEGKLNGYFGTATGATWMLCAIISHYFDNHGDTCSFNNLSKFFDCSVMSIIAYRKDMQALLEKHYISNKNNILGDEIGLTNEFEISSRFLAGVLHNEPLPSMKDDEKKDTILDMIEKFGNLIESNELFFEKLSKSNILEERFAGHQFVKDVKKLLPGDMQERMFFYDSCNDFIRGNETSLSATIDDIYPTSCKFRIAESFLDESNALLKADLLEFTKKGSLTDSILELTPKAKEMLLGEDAKLFTKAARGTNVILPEKITAKELFYAPENEGEITRLTSSLMEENLARIQAGLSEKGLPKGIAVLLYGAPGTGKTETVYQIARTTGRKILHVDISSSKSCWFGESEKNIKRVFTDYKNLCKSCRGEKGGRTPILLFNEADGILSKRKDVTSGNVAQTENAIQNIILEEMESLEGILVATTNLADNLDAAFERRFLFKIRVENPSADAKQKIWKSKLDWLSESDARAFANDYDLSGGQIDNIVRKITMDEVLTGKLPDMDALVTMCRNEKLGSSEHRIGFF